jgi:hypothetical protein
MPFFSDIRSHFMPPHGVDNFGSRTAMMLIQNEGDTPRLNQTLMGVSVNKTPCRHYNEEGSKWQLIPATLDYPNTKTHYGHCGSPIVTNFHGVHICGLHVACTDEPDGLSSTGHAEIVTRAEITMLEEMRWFDIILKQGNPLTLLPRSVAPQYCIEEKESKWFHEEEDIAITPVGVINKPCVLPMRDKDKPSPLYDKIYKHTTGNSVIRPNDPRVDEELRHESPLKRAHRKYGNPSEGFLPYIMTYVLSFLSEMFKPRPGAIRRVLTYDEAINGMPDEPFCEKLNMATAPGYGWNVNGKTGKECWFDVVDGKYVMKPELEDACELYLQGLKDNEIGNHLWKATLKTERRPLEKIKKGKTRHFDIAQLPYVLVSRRLYLAFNMNFLAGRHETFSGAGVNPYSREWHRFATYLLAAGPDMFDIDYEQFDSRCSREMMGLAFQVRNDWYDDEYRQVRDNLCSEMLFRFEVVGDAISQLCCGNPSGDSGTTVTNTLIGCAYVRYTYIIAAPLELSSDEAFLENVHCKILGDDCVIAVSPKVRDFFNPTSMKEILSDYGVTITSASSQGQAGKGDLGGFSTIENVTFLKCGFFFSRELGKIFVPTMALNTIHELTNWVSAELEDDFALCVDNCNTALRMLMFYGEKEFSVMRRRISVELDRLPCVKPYKLVTYIDLQWQFLIDNVGYFPNMAPTTRAKQALESPFEL